MNRDARYRRGLDALASRRRGVSIGAAAASPSSSSSSSSSPNTYRVPPGDGSAPCASPWLKVAAALAAGFLLRTALAR